MSATGLFVPKIDERLWHDPFTPHGLRPRAGEAGDSFQIHECGVLRLGPGWNYRGVRSPFWRLYHDQTPGAWIVSQGRRHLLDPGRVVLVPDGVAFDCGSRPGADHLWVHFSLYLSLTTATAGVIEVPAGPAIRTVARELYRMIGRREADHAAHYCAGLLHLVFAGVGPEGFETVPLRLRKLFGWIRHSLAGEITNEHMAAQVGLSVEAFIRWFKAGTGRTPAAFVAERRIREACRQLTFSEESIEQIAEAVGFANRHHFSRVFKQYAGCGPARFRANGRRADPAESI
ncbi:MAG: helix-turn-helix protein [Verrucomicrobia bacterium]|nr:helix-turn-helix protein [Verrucomicrobiota bacterium]